MSETPVVLPKWGLTMLDATLVEWLKQEGERGRGRRRHLPRRDRQGRCRGDGARGGRARPAARAQGRRRARRDDADDDPRGRRLAPGVRIDHAIIGAREIEAVADRLWERHGLASLPGGRHPGWGTHNRIVPLGGSYLEIIGVADENEALRDPMGRWLLAQHGDGRSARWAGAARPATSSASRAGSGCRSSAAGASGPTARASPGASPGARAALGARPFFIAWDEPGMRPGLLERAARRRGARASRASRSAAAPRSSRAGSTPTSPCARSGDGGGLLAVVIATAAGRSASRAIHEAGVNSARAPVRNDGRAVLSGHATAHADAARRASDRPRGAARHVRGGPRRHRRRPALSRLLSSAVPTRRRARRRAAGPRRRLAHLQHPVAAPRFEPATFELSITGLVEQPLRLRWNEVAALPGEHQTSDFHCVTGWSVDNVHWEGIRPQTIIDLVRRRPRRSSSRCSRSRRRTSTRSRSTQFREPDVMLAAARTASR